MPVPSLRALLSGGDRRSIGRVAEVLTQQRQRPRLVRQLVALLRDPDPIVAMRAADALEKASREQPLALPPHRTSLLRLLTASRQQEVQWHLAQMLPRLQLTPAQVRRVIPVLEGYLRSPSSIVRTNALEALAALAARHPVLLPQARRHVATARRTGTPAMQARARRLLARLRRPVDRGITTA